MIRRLVRWRQVIPGGRSIFIRSLKELRIGKRKSLGRFMKGGLGRIWISCLSFKFPIILWPVWTLSWMILPVDPKNLRPMWGQAIMGPWSRACLREGSGGPLLRKGLKTVTLSGPKSRSMTFSTSNSKPLFKNLGTSTAQPIHRSKIVKSVVPQRNEKHSNPKTSKQNSSKTMNFTTTNWWTPKTKLYTREHSSESPSANDNSLTNKSLLTSKNL